jgi:hypothetical protein
MQNNSRFDTTQTHIFTSFPNTAVDDMEEVYIFSNFNRKT